MADLYFFYIFSAVWQFISEFLPFGPFVFLLVYSYNKTSFDTSAYYTDGFSCINIVIIIFIIIVIFTININTIIIIVSMIYSLL